MGDKGGKKDKQKKPATAADEAETSGAKEAGEGAAQDSVA